MRAQLMLMNVYIHSFAKTYTLNCDMESKLVKLIESTIAVNFSQ